MSAISIAYPERIPTKAANGKSLSFSKLLAILYIYLGATGAVVLLSKTILMPLYQQLVEDRLNYSSVYLNHLRILSGRLSRSIEARRKVAAEANSSKNMSGLASSNKLTSFSSLLDKHEAIMAVSDSNTVVKDLLQRTEKLQKLVSQLKFSAFTVHSEKMVLAQDLRKEIRQMKGSLLMARRIPPVARVG